MGTRGWGGDERDVWQSSTVDDDGIAIHELVLHI